MKKEKKMEKGKKMAKGSFNKLEGNKRSAAPTFVRCNYLSTDTSSQL